MNQNEGSLVDEAAALLRVDAREAEDFEDRRQAWLDRFYLTKNPKVWQVRVDGRTVKLEDVPLELVDPIAKKCGISWFAVVNTPLVDLRVALELYGAVEAYLGLCGNGHGPPPGSVRALEWETPEALSARQLWEVFELIDDKLPEPEVVVDDDDPFATPGSTTETAG